MNDSYIPGLTNSMRHMAVGGAVTPTSANPTADILAAQQANMFVQPTYSPELQAYLDSVNAYAGAQEAPFGSFSSGIQLARPITGPGFSFNQYINPTELQSYVGQPVENNVRYNFNVPVDSGSPSGSVSVGYNTPIYLINPKTGEVISGGVGFDAAKQVANKARELSVSQGRKANWEIYTGTPGSTDPSAFTRAARDDPNKGILGKIADIGLPLIGTVLAGPLGSALGSAASGTLQGRSLGDILKGAAVSGALSSVSGQLFGGGVMGDTFSEVAKSGTGSALGSAAGSAASSGIANALGNEIVVSGLKSAIPGMLASGLPATIGNAAIPGLLSSPTVPDLNEIVVSANKAPPVNQNAGGLAPVTGALGSVITPQVTQPPAQEAPVDQASEDDIIEVRKMLDRGISSTELMAMGIPAVTITAATAASGGAGAGSTATSNTTPSNTNGPTNLLEGTPYNNTGILDKLGGLPLSEQIRLGLLAAGTVAGAFGGGGDKGTPGTIPGGLGGGLDAMFNAKLPAANIALPVARPAANIDYKRYGYGPEQSFFTNVPQGAPNTSTAYTGYEEREGLARGGQPRSDFAVGGPGHGRSDEIPAMLSDGEYVIDAETVALLGNGSSKAGAKALDAFRVNVRKQKGRKLAKGEFSVNAKRPEQYLKGRK